ncbi:MAG: Omp28-related outer membrane protein [Bacteroidales bacterium]|nr:Omp28-related outer membrane protein [Bacteroidales bacterium]
MKNVKAILLMMSVCALAACHGNQDGGEVNSDGTVEPYTLTVDKQTIESDGIDFATLTITDAAGQVLTEGYSLRNASFYIEETDEWRSGIGSGEDPNKFSSIVDGTYTITAMYNGIECEAPVQITSQNRNKYERFHKNVAIYRLTGTWCQYCPYMTEALNNRDAYTKDHSIVMEFHNADEFSVAYSMQMDMAAYLLNRFAAGDGGYPYCIYSITEGSGKRTVNDIKRFVKNRLVEHPAHTGIKATSTLDGDKLSVNATVMASVDGKYDLGIAVLKDNCVPTSASAFEDVYNDVVLSVSGNFYAMSTDSFSLKADAEKVVEKTWESDKLDSKNCRVVLFTLRETDGKVIIDNAVDFKVGDSVDYRYN